ncbi:MAG TPA: glycosyltransferase family 39 protein [Vicinamibacteria bacterium]|jgi:4-amino-4-deoxy-L-arabinose transferase-like glycosyltransferase
MTDVVGVIVAFVVMLVANAFIVRRIRQRLPADEGAALARIYVWTLVLRVALACFLNAYAGQTTFAVMFWGDSATYDDGGWLMSLQWDGQGLLNPYYSGKVSGWGFFYLISSIYYVFGHNQLLAQFVNATIGAVTVLVIYAIAKDLFDVDVAQWAGRFMAFFPQMIFWSGAIYKDPAIMLCIALCMYAVLKLNHEFTVRYVVLFVGASLALMTLRFYVFYFVAFATMGTFVLSQRRGVAGSIGSYLVLIAVFIGAFSFAARQETVEQQRSYFTLERLQITRSDQAMWGQSAYAPKADVSTTQGVISVLPVGLAYLLFAPFPWAVHNLRQALTIPETLVWYALMPALIRGLFFTIRTRFRPALPILVFAASLTCAYAVFQGNVGTAYRQRTQVTMFYFILMAAGVVERRRARQGAQPSLGTPALQVS